MGYDYYDYAEQKALESIHDYLLLMDNTQLIIGSVLTLLSAIVLLALCVFVLIAIKRGRVFGIFACLAYVFGMIVQWLNVISNALSGRARWEYVTTHNVLDISSLIRFMLTEEPLIYLIISLCLTVIFYVCVILMAVYCGKQLKSPKKGFAIAAMILVIAYGALQFLGLFSPMFTIYPKAVVQLIWTVIYNGLLTLPALLLAVQGIFVMIDNKKKKARLDS